ncbi:MAG: hypothetical protein WDW38_007288 [Sanguina aurantia]
MEEQEHCLTDLPVDVWVSVLQHLQVSQPALGSLRHASRELRNRVDAVTTTWNITSCDFASGNPCDADITSRFPALHTLHFTAIGVSRRKPLLAALPSPPLSPDSQHLPSTPFSQATDQPTAKQDCYTDQECLEYSEWGEPEFDSSYSKGYPWDDSTDASAHASDASLHQSACRSAVSGSSSGGAVTGNAGSSVLEASHALETLATHVLHGLPALRTVTLTLGDNASLSLAALSALTDACPELHSMTLPLSLGNILHPQRSLIFGMQLHSAAPPSDATPPPPSGLNMTHGHRSPSGAVVSNGYSTCGGSGSGRSRTGMYSAGTSCGNGSGSLGGKAVQATHATTPAPSQPTRPAPPCQKPGKSHPHPKGGKVSAADKHATPSNTSHHHPPSSAPERGIPKFVMTPAAAAIAADRRASPHSGPSLTQAGLQQGHNQPQRIPDLLRALPCRLRQLTLHACDAAGASSLAHLSRLSHLRALQLHSLRLSDAKLAKLQPLSALTALTVVCPVSRQGNLGALKEVAASFGGLASSLVSLHLTHCSVLCAATASAPPLPREGHGSLINSPCDSLPHSIATGYGHQLSVLQQLQRLECNTLVVGGAEMEALHKIPRLQHLSVLAFRGLSRSEARLLPLTALTSLELEHALSSEREAEVLFTGLPALQRLRWQGRASALTGELTSEQLVQLTVLQKLEQLDLPVAIIYGQPRLERSLQDWVLSAWSHHAKWPLKILHLSGGADVTEGAMVEFVLSKPTIEEITLSVFYQFGFEGLLSMASPARMTRITLKSCKANNEDCTNVMAVLQRPGLSVTRLP